mgnify:CR=1 FL=1
MAQFFNERLNWLAEFIGLTVGVDSWLGDLLAAGVHIFLLIQVVAVGAPIFIWMERKIAGRLPDRRLGAPSARRPPRPPFREMSLT